MAQTLSFVVPSTNGTYTSPIYNIGNTNNFEYIVGFEFYDDEELTIPSTGVTGTITLNGKNSPNGIWQNIPNSLVPTTIDASNPLSPNFTGLIYQLQVITNSLANTSYIKVIVNFLNQKVY